MVLRSIKKIKDGPSTLGSFINAAVQFLVSFEGWLVCWDCVLFSFWACCSGVFGVGFLYSLSGCCVFLLGVRFVFLHSPESLFLQLFF